MSPASVAMRIQGTQLAPTPGAGTERVRFGGGRGGEEERICLPAGVHPVATDLP